MACACTPPCCESLEGGLLGLLARGGETSDGHPAPNSAEPHCLSKGDGPVKNRPKGGGAAVGDAVDGFGVCALLAAVSTQPGQ